MFKRYGSFFSAALLMAAVSESSAGSGGFAEAVGASDAPATPAAPNVVNGKEVKYFFKTEKIKDEEGKPIGEGRKHPDVTAVLPMPSPVDVINYLSNFGATEKVNKDGKEVEVPTLLSKVAKLVMEGVEELVISAGRSQINDFLEKDPKGTFTANNFDLSKLTLEFIATLEKGRRGAWAPSDEDMKAFTDDYTQVMVHLVNYDPKKVKVHCDVFSKGLSKVKADKVAVDKMKQFLVLYASKATEDAMKLNEQTYEWLMGKADKYLEAEEKNFADAL